MKNFSTCEVIIETPEFITLLEEYRSIVSHFLHKVCTFETLDEEVFESVHSAKNDTKKQIEIILQSLFVEEENEDFQKELIEQVSSSNYKTLEYMSSSLFERTNTPKELVGMFHSLLQTKNYANSSYQKKLLEDTLYNNRRSWKAGAQKYLYSLLRSTDSKYLLTVPKDTDVLPNFHKEGEVLNMCDHKRIPKIFGMMRNPDAAIIENIDGARVLNEVINKQTTLDFFLHKFLYPVLDVLSYIHSKRFVHHDIKPGNIVFDKNDELFLVDFGACVDFYNSSPKITGTLGTFPPDVIHGMPPDAKIDIYGIGALIYFLFSDKFPLERPNDVQDWNMYLQCLAALNFKDMPNITMFFDREDIEGCNGGEIFESMADHYGGGDEGYNHAYFIFEGIVRESEPLEILNTPSFLPGMNSFLRKEFHRILMKMISTNPQKRYQNIENLVFDLDMWRESVTESELKKFVFTN